MVLSLSVVAPQESPVDAPRGITEQDVTIGSGEWALSGTLTLPPGRGRFRALVLVHGSGPGDRDESMGPNKPFRDLAWGLAPRGIAVLRYEKRTRQHGAKMAASHRPLSIREETLDDAIEAVQVLKSRPEVDSRHIYLLGHSMGGSLAPRIATMAGGLAGIIIVAGSNRKPWEMMSEQTDYVLTNPNLPAEDRKQAEEVRAAARKLRDPKTNETEIVLGQPVSYWRWWRTYDPVAEAARLESRILIIHFGRDYMVTEKDLAGWKNGLARHKNVTLKIYPRLNHAFRSGTGMGTPEEFSHFKPASPELIQDIAEWIKEHK